MFTVQACFAFLLSYLFQFCPVKMYSQDLRPAVAVDLAPLVEEGGAGALAVAVHPSGRCLRVHLNICKHILPEMGKSQIRKFLGSFRYCKSASFLGVPVGKLQNRKF